MSKFRVLRGLHVDRNGEYQVGDVVETETDLVERFGREKFERVVEDIPAKPRKAKAAVEP